MTRVLVVDDKEENLYYLQALLSANGFDVDAARHGAEALVLARQTPCALVISDLLMPVMDGYTLLRQWKADAHLRSAPFIVYTATYTEPEDERLALDLGADAFILKPSEPDAFLDRVREVLARSNSAQPIQDDPEVDEGELLKTYSSTLIRKLEEKTYQLEEVNQTLQADIAKREAAEVALRASETEFRLLVSSIPHIVWVASPDGRMLNFNERWAEFTGLPLDDTLAAGWDRAIHPDDRDHTSTRAREAMAVGEAFEVEYRLRRADGVYHWMLGLGRPLRDDTGEIVKWYGTSTDIEELKQAQAKMREHAQERARAAKALERLLEAERQANEELRSLEQLRTNFLTAVSHELRTPLTVVLGMAVSLEQHATVLDEEQRTELTRRLRLNAERLERLLEDLLDLNRLSSNQLSMRPSPQDLREIVLAAVREVDGGEDVDLEVDVPAIALEADGPRLGRVVVNLLRNARIHTPPGTAIRIEATEQGPMVTLRVIDRGPGIEDRLKEQIFEPFEQGPSAPRHQPGTGIGLSLAREFVAMHHGRLWVEDTPGGGATFVVELPRHAPS